MGRGSTSLERNRSQREEKSRTRTGKSSLGEGARLSGRYWQDWKQAMLDSIQNSCSRLVASAISRMGRLEAQSPPESPPILSFAPLPPLT